MIYLDYNATQPTKPAVLEAMAAAGPLPGNASSVHAIGRRARRLVETARTAVADMIGAGSGEILFTAGATEANATALAGAAAERVLISAVEHPSVGRARSDAETIPVDSDGRIDLDALDRLLAERPARTLVSVMLINNETGVVQPVAEAARIAHAHGALIHSDAAQAPGRLAVDVRRLGIDLLTLSAHKIGGPLGAGALFVRKGLDLRPLFQGGGQEHGRRPGTENVPAILGFGVAAGLAAGDLARAPALARLRDDLEQRLRVIAPDLVIHGAAAERVCQTSCFGAPGLRAETALMALDLADIAVSSGAACSSGAVEPSQILLAMGQPRAAAREAIRISFGWGTEPADIDHLVETWSIVYRRAQRRAAEPAQLARSS